MHAIQDDGSIREIYKVSGGPYGGIRVNQQFEALLDELLDSQKLQTYRKQYSSDWICLMNEFEGKKRRQQILDSKVMTNIRLPRSFVSLVKQCWRSGYDGKDIKLKNNEYLALSSQIMKRLFDPVIGDIKKHLRSLQRNPQLSKVATMLLVGGFSDSALLQEEIKREFSRKFRVLIPNHAAFAIVHGAVMFGKKPSKMISEGVVRKTYGMECTSNFIRGLHREEKKFFVDGIEKCNDKFDVFVRENSTVRNGQIITRQYNPRRATDITIRLNFYVTNNPDAEYVTDPGMMKIGQMTIQSPDTWRGKGRKIEVSMYFGRTEITVTATDVSSGNVARATLDFFHL